MNTLTRFAAVVNVLARRDAFTVDLRTRGIGPISDCDQHGATRSDCLCSKHSQDCNANNALTRSRKAVVFCSRTNASKAVLARLTAVNAPPRTPLNTRRLQLEVQLQAMTLHWSRSITCYTT